MDLPTRLLIKLFSKIFYLRSPIDNPAKFGSHWLKWLNFAFPSLLKHSLFLHNSPCAPCDGISSVYFWWFSSRQFSICQFVHKYSKASYGSILICAQYNLGIIFFPVIQPKIMSSNIILLAFRTQLSVWWLELFAHSLQTFLDDYKLIFLQLQDREDPWNPESLSGKCETHEREKFSHT